MDPMQMWSMNFDGALDGQVQQQQQQQQGGNPANMNGIFMGATTPHGTNMM